MDANVLDFILKSGPFGIVLVLILLGWLVPKRHLEDVREDRNAWKLAYQAEHEARMKLEHIGENSVEQGQLAVTLLNELRKSQIGRGD